VAAIENDKEMVEDGNKMKDVPFEEHVSSCDLL